MSELLDVIRLPGTTHNMTGWNAGTLNGNWDDSWTTFTGYSQSAGGGTLSTTYRCEHILPFTIPLKEINYHIKAQTNTDGYSSSPDCSCNGQIEVWYSGDASYTTLWNYSGSGGTSSAFNSGVVYQEGLWSDVEKVRVSVYMRAQADHDTQIQGWTYMIEAFSDVYGYAQII